MEYEPNRLRKSLEKIGKRLIKRAVVYATSDLTTLHLARLKEELPDDFHFVVGDKEAVEILVVKSKFYKALAKAGMDYPITYFPENLEHARKISIEINYPVFVKPSITQLFNKLIGAREKGFVAYSPRELMNYYELTVKRCVEIMFQEIVPGLPTNSYQLEGYYDNNYDPKVLFARKRLRIWPPDFGNTTLCVSIPLSELAEEERKVKSL